MSDEAARTMDRPEPGDTAADEAHGVAPAALRPSLEALLMVADQPLDQVSLAAAVGHPVDAVVDTLNELAGEYADQGRGFELRNVAGGWRYYTREEHAAVVEGFVLEGQQARLTQAALETLAVVAYKQPVSRARVSAIRGVNVDGVMRTLLARGLVEEAGQDGETGANLYRTTSYFLERIGVTSIAELPELAPFLPDIEDMEDDLAAMTGTLPSAPDNGADVDQVSAPGPDQDPSAADASASGVDPGLDPGIDPRADRDADPDADPGADLDIPADEDAWVGSDEAVGAQMGLQMDDGRVDATNASRLEDGRQ